MMIKLRSLLVCLSITFLMALSPDISCAAPQGDIVLNISSISLVKSGKTKMLKLKTTITNNADVRSNASKLQLDYDNQKPAKKKTFRLVVPTLAAGQTVRKTFTIKNFPSYNSRVGRNITPFNGIIQFQLDPDVTLSSGELTGKAIDAAPYGRGYVYLK
jgi:hypothetical protein